jgi:hypothetical protein
MNRLIKLKPTAKQAYKIGVDEIEGLKEAMQNAMLPIRDALRDKAYWDRELAFDDMEYKGRDGFIPYSHNHGGVVLGLHVPECEQYDWGFLEFGEHGECCDENGCNQDGELDAYLRIILKFEGVDEDGNLQFYMNMAGGNNDAPYFRVSELPDLFEAEFTCKSVAGLKRAAAKHVNSILKTLTK